MASFFSDAEKLSIDGLFNDLHDTFKTIIYVFVEEASSVLSDTDYNPLYNKTRNRSKGLLPTLDPRRKTARCYASFF
jgi:hypothetical protein